MNKIATTGCGLLILAASATWAATSPSDAQDRTEPADPTTTNQTATPGQSGVQGPGSSGVSGPDIGADATPVFGTRPIRQTESSKFSQPRMVAVPKIGPRPDHAVRHERPERPERHERPERVERPERPERGPRH